MVMINQSKWRTEIFAIGLIFSYWMAEHRVSNIHKRILILNACFHNSKYRKSTVPTADIGSSSKGLQNLSHINREAIANFKK